MTLHSRTGRRRLLVIYNPVAGGRARRRFEAALKEMRELGVETVLRETRSSGDAEAFAREATAEDFDGVVVAGGDGTLNEAVNGLRDLRLPVAVFPFGTGNVLAHEIGMPRSPARLAAIAAAGPVRPISVGEAVFENQPVVRRFLLMTGVGFDAEVVEGLDLGLKRRAGKLAFVWSILKRLWRYRPTEFSVMLEGETGVSEHHAASAVATKARCYAGPFVLAPAAQLSNRSFQLALFRNAGRRAALGYLVALAGGFLHRLTDIEFATARAARFTLPRGAPVQIDGDVAGLLPVTIRIAEEPLLLVYPGV